MQWQASDGSRYIIGHDVRLAELAEYTTRLTLGSRGRAALFTSEGKLLAPPADPQFSDEAKISQALLKDAGDAALPDLASAYSNWLTNGQPANNLNGFDLPDGRWLSLFRPMDISTQKIWIGVFAPGEDFNPASRQDLLVIVLTTISSLALGLVVAIRLARRFGEPLQRLTEESERIGRLELDQPVATDASWREVEHLANALESMRQHLQLSQEALQNINIDLEQTVARRTHALHESQEILRKREAIFRAIFDNAAVGIVSLDPLRKPTLLNPAYAAFIGRPVDALLGKPMADILPITEPGRLQKAIDAVASGERDGLRSEFEFIGKAGEPLWGDVQIAAVHNGKGELDSLLVTVLDVTDRREIEAELIRQFAFLQALLDTIPNPIFYKGANTRFLGCNKAYEAFFGVDRGEFIGKRVLDLEYLPEEARQAYQAEDESVIASNGRISRETSMYGADGKAHDTLYSVTGFQTSEGEPGGLIGVIVDISLLKEAEREAERARAVAEEAAAAKADFLANMSHEIRTPMNAIIGMTHLAMQTELTPRQKNYLSKVDNAAKGLLGIINDILDLSKIEAGKMLVEHIPFRLDDNLQNLADVSLVKASERGLELLFDVSSEVPDYLVGDPLRLNQVLLNLVGNAIKFTEKGEITLSVSQVSRSENSVELRFEVRDTGIGMTEEQQQRLFSAFSQADSSTTRKYGGTGLGLSICKRIVEMMGGEIGVDSVPGVGSRFHFTVPFELSADIPDKVQRLGLPDQLNTLIIDDSAGARQIFRQLLLALGLPCHAVASGAEGIAEVRRANAAGEPYQLLIIDWQMPSMDGVHTLHQMQQAGLLLSQPKIILTTAFNQDELRATLGESTVDAFLGKPVTPSSLFDSIIEAMNAGDPALSSNLPSPGKAGVKFNGQRVLLVEDNEVNRELAEEMLTSVGLTVDLAVNGQEAVNSVQQGNYDMVLMDCHMPVMDGYEATRRIRREERFKRLPIIAMTANALPSDRQQCLVAGMDDHIAKPIDVSLLYATLAHWLTGGEARAPAEPARPTPAAPEIEEGESLPVLDERAALSRLGENRALLERLLIRFHENQSDIIERLHNAQASGDRDGMTIHAHTLRGLAGNIGANRLAEAARRLEISLKETESGNNNEINKLINELATALAPVLEISGQVRTREEPKIEARQTNLETARNSLRELFSLLEHADASAVRLFEEIRPWLSQQITPSQLDQLTRNIEDYEFEDAMEILRRIADEISVELNKA